MSLTLIAFYLIFLYSVTTTYIKIHIFPSNQLCTVLKNEKFTLTEKNSSNHLSVISLAKPLFSRNIFSVRVNFSFFHTVQYFFDFCVIDNTKHQVLITSQMINPTIFDQTYMRHDLTPRKRSNTNFLREIGYISV